MNIFMLLLKNLCALGVLAVKMPFFQGSLVLDDIVATMTNFANNVSQVRVGIMFEMVTVTALVILSVLLYVTLKQQNREIALVALGLRIVEVVVMIVGAPPRTKMAQTLEVWKRRLPKSIYEVGLLAVSRVVTFALLSVSEVSAIAGHPADLQTLGNLAFDTREFAYSLNMVFFTLGGTLFYYLIFKSGYVPRALSLLGLIAAPLAFIGTVLELLGYSVPLVVFIPNLPFELAIGLWLLVKGIRDQPTTTEAS